MEKSATVGVFERLGGWLYDDVQLRSSSSEENGPYPFGTGENETIQLWAQSVRQDIERIKRWAQTMWRTIAKLIDLPESKKIQMWAQLVQRRIARMANLTEGDKIRLMAEILWPDTFRLNCMALGKPNGPVTRQYSYEAYVGQPMEQRVPDTCAPVACTVCVDAVHRFQYEKLHGVGTFPIRALEPDDLMQACHNDGIWMPEEGAYTYDVLVKIQGMNKKKGLPATTTTNDATTPAARCFLPLRSFKQHRWDNYADGGLSAWRVAALLHRHGPCIGVLWVCPWYHRFDADRDDTLVYRGCGRSEGAREHSKEVYGDKVGSHAVVCIGYRFCGDQMHVLVLDNHSDTGPRRWIDVEELDTLYSLTVDPLHLGGL